MNIVFLRRALANDEEYRSFGERIIPDIKTLNANLAMANPHYSRRVRGIYARGLWKHCGETCVAIPGA